MSVQASAEPPACATAGGPGTRLLAGPPPSAGAEPLTGHAHRLGGPPAGVDLAELARAGLTGRGGGGFPFAEKLRVAAGAPGTPVVVVNASESEPASRKDQALLELRPHLVLDGALAAARSVGADEILVYLHSARRRSARTLLAALAERDAAGRDAPLAVTVVDAPPGFLAGESSVVVSVIGGGPALPTRHPVPAAVRGVDGRPTVVSNVETYAHLALIARFGAGWFRQAGSAQAPGSTLLTLAGAVSLPGLVVELLAAAPLREVLTDFGGLERPPRAVLLGGYSGSWVDGAAAWEVPLDRERLAAAGAGLGCGLVAVLADEACGLAETRRLLGYLAGQSAGQCGPCVFGLAELARAVGSLAGGGGRGELRRVRRLLAGLRGRGACGHPDGVLRLVETAVEVFGPEVHDHARRGRCAGRRRCAPTSGLPLPPALHLVGTAP